MKKILVLTSGGDAPGMNAAIRAVVRTALYYDIEVVGCRSGYQGLVRRDLFPLDACAVANCIQLGGTILKTDRCPPFREKSTRDKCRTFLDEEGIEGMVVIGGDGSFRGASLLHQEGGPKVIGIPATIDNDISGTTYTIGFDTARNTALQVIDKIRDTASSHDNDFIVEVMGRNAGFLAVDVGIAAGSDGIVIPEFQMSMDTLADHLNQLRRKLSSIIVVAEGHTPGRSFELAKILEEKTSRHYRVCVIGHTQRGGSPSVLDRKIATLMGAKAIKSLHLGESNKMVAYLDDDLVLADFPDPEKPSRYFENEALLKTNRIVCK